MPAVPSFLARERTVAGPGFSRWLIPPCALAVHLCIGQVYETVGSITGETIGTEPRSFATSAGE